MRAGLTYAGDAPRVSLVVPTWAGASGHLDATLEGIAALRSVLPEIVVVFDGPADACVARVRAVLPAARHLRLRENVGFAAAAGAGLRAAKGRLVALLNDDAVPDPDWLAALVSAADRDPDAGSFACRVLRPDGAIDSCGHGLTRWGEPFHVGEGAEDGAAWDADRPVFGPVAAAALYRWELLRDCGGFDGGYGAYLEDVELSLRAQLLGFPCRYVGAARVVHRGSASYGADPDAKARRVARNRLRLLARAMPRDALRPLPAAISLFASAVAAPAGWPGLELGIREFRAAAGERPAILGGRRIDEAAIDTLLRASEDDFFALPACSSRRRARLRLGRLLAAMCGEPNAGGG